MQHETQMVFQIVVQYLAMLHDISFRVDFNLSIQALVACKRITSILRMPFLFSKHLANNLKLLLLKGSGVAGAIELRGINENF